MIDYIVYLITVAGVYALLGLSLNLLWGMSGMINMGVVGVFACGAYASALVTVKAGWPVVAGWITGMVIAAVAGFVLAGLTRKMRGDYLAIVTLGFAEVVRLVATNETWLTRGSDGISGIPAPLKSILGPTGFNFFYAVITWIIVAFVAWLLARLFASPYGRALRALRREIMEDNGWSLRELYRTLETPGDNQLRTAHTTLDAAVRAAYGMKPEEDILAFLIKLNLELAAREAKGEAIMPPGLPAWVEVPQSFISTDCVTAEGPGHSEDGSTAQSAAAAAHFYGKEDSTPYRSK